MTETHDYGVVVEPTDDGLFIAYALNRLSCYAYGETADEAAENLLDCIDFRAEQWADPDEYCYLTGIIQ